jgi:phage replication initiation protein
MRAIVDWCTCTFAFREESITEFLQHLARVTGLQLVADERRSRPGYADGLQIMAMVNFQLVKFAVLAYGGESQRGRAMLDLSGECCGCIDDWRVFQCFLESLPESKLTRADTAVDLFNGEFTVDDAVQWHEQGLFNCRGREPSTRTDGDWLREREGRTLYVGKTKNGKGLRCYEKGKQGKDYDSKWVRFEVQFGNRDREIPFDILTDPTKYFVAAYPALEKIVDAAGERIKTISTTAAVTMANIFTALKRTYGKYIHVAMNSGIEITDLVEGLRVHAVPSRIQSSAVVADVLSDTTKSTFEKWSTQNAIQS